MPYFKYVIYKKKENLITLEMSSSYQNMYANVLRDNRNKYDKNGKQKNKNMGKKCVYILAYKKHHEHGLLLTIRRHLSSFFA